MGHFTDFFVRLHDLLDPSLEETKHRGITHFWQRINKLEARSHPWIILPIRSPELARTRTRTSTTFPPPSRKGPKPSPNHLPPEIAHCTFSSSTASHFEWGQFFRPETDTRLRNFLREPGCTFVFRPHQWGTLVRAGLVPDFLGKYWTQNFSGKKQTPHTQSMLCFFFSVTFLTALHFDGQLLAFCWILLCGLQISAKGVFQCAA